MTKRLSHESEMEKKLLNLDKIVLIRALIDASYRDEVTSSVLDRLVSNRNENVTRFKKRLKEICNKRDYVTWKYTSQYANEVYDLLEDLKEGANSSREGLVLLECFFVNDGKIIECCDDSSGEVGNIFTYNATELFEEYAKECSDKKFVSEMLLGLILDNGYGLRDGLTNNMDSFLPEKEIRFLVDKLWKRYHLNKKEDTFYTSELHLLEDMANALKDPILYEEIIKIQGSKNKDYDNFRLGKIWLKSGNHSKSLEYLEKVDKKSSHYLNGLNEILTTVYKKLGNVDKVKSIAWDEFNAYRSKEHFDAVIKLEGKDQKEQILNDEISKINKDSKLNSQNVEFLLEMKLVDEANTYVLKRRKDLDGYAYYSLPSWAKKFEKKKYYMATVLIYRALLDSILARAYSKAYHHGVDYLKKLESISPKIDKWKENIDHDHYFNQIKEQHKRKSSFWARYRGERH